nr:LysR family transcriptional regulator [Motilibacter aurantiacus]
MRVFLAVVDTGAIPAAARSLHVTEMSVRNNLHELESSVGSRPLLAKSAAGLVPTGHGERVAAVARMMLAHATELSSPERLRPVVAFAAGQARWVVDALRESGGLEEVELRVLTEADAGPDTSDGPLTAQSSGQSSGQLTGQLLSGTIDLLVTPMPQAAGQETPVRVDELYRSQLLALVEARRQSVPLEELRSGRVLTVRSAWATSMLQAAARVEGIGALAVDTASPDPYALVVLAEAGMGTAVLPADIAALVADGPVTRSWAPVLHRGTVLETPVCLLTRRDVSRRVERVRTSLRLAAAARRGARPAAVGAAASASPP